jgi:hypothetical protein
MYGLKPVPFKLKPVPFRLKPVPFKGGDTQDYFNKLLRKKPLIIVLTVYSNWRTAILPLPLSLSARP